MDSSGSSCVINPKACLGADSVFQGGYLGGGGMGGWCASRGDGRQPVRHNAAMRRPTSTPAHASPNHAAPGLLKHAPGMGSSSSDINMFLVFFLLRAAVQGLCLRSTFKPSCAEAGRCWPVAPDPALLAGVSGLVISPEQLLTSLKGPLGSMWW